VDSALDGARNRQFRNPYQLPPGVIYPHYVGIKEPASIQTLDQVMPWNLQWGDIEWLRSFIKVPMLVKGVMNPADAETFIKMGVDGIIVSNHGGRCLDTQPATIEALPRVVAAVAGRVPVIVDGGIRRGTDVVKAIALGASAVQIGRPYVYGLATGGAPGVTHVLKILREEMLMAMSLLGCPTIASINLLGVAYNLRFRNNLPRARELILSGAIGRVQSLHYSMIRQLANLGNFGGNKLGWVSLPESIGFVLGGLTHGVDAIRWAMDAEVTKTAGFCRTFTPGRVIEDTTVGIMELSNGSICSVHTTTAAHGEFPGEMARLIIHGSAGSLDIDTFGKMHRTDRAKGWRLETEQTPVRPDDPEAAFKSGRMQAFYDQIQSFIDGIHGQPMRVANGHDGRQGVTACLAMLASSQKSQAINPA
jgi:hypothetical protein